MLAKRLAAMPKILSVMSLLLVAALSSRAEAFDIELKKPPDTVLESMIGQMIMVGFSGYRITDSDVIRVRDQLADGTVGGVVLYPENIGPPDQLRALTAFLRARPTPVPCGRDQGPCPSGPCAAAAAQRGGGALGRSPARTR